MTSSHSVTDWITAMQQGDAKAANAIVERFRQKLVNVAKGTYRSQFNNILRSVEDEEDAAQSVLRSFVLHLDRNATIANRNHLQALLAIITMRKVYQQRRRVLTEKRSGGDLRSVSNEDLDALLDDLADPAAASEFEDTWKSAMAALTPKLLSVVRLWLEDKTVGEIAETLGVTERTVYRRLNDIQVVWEGYFGDTLSD